MDKELLARKLYCQRINNMVGSHHIDEQIISELWESRTNPVDAVKSILSENDSFDGPAWLSRYLQR
ncbi:hypothetical protein R3X26_06365 [Vibrio sp. TH_r3]|uniref:hypothetical protein n=1 Tax=Vibrio sp. TH_r3 TaxID=3082084 RepID=UPI0029537314|nr:hypothetical protein [Vibrio sp. TH_r3]MDV7104034.1 hypothetical protein [Vibrio sp. TH_r3]